MPATNALWSPTAKQIEQSNIHRFIKHVNKARGLKLADYPTLYDWSVDQHEAFWAELWDFCDVKASKRWDQVLQDGHKMPGATWFTGARLNFAENLLRFRDHRPALLFRGEDKLQAEYSFAELYSEVAKVAHALKQLGVKPGDRVAGFMPNLPQTVVAMLAATSLGAVWSSCSPDFGVQGVLDRFSQIEPKVLFAADGYYYAGKTIDSLARIADIAAQLPSIEKLVIIPYLDANPDIDHLPRAINWLDFADNSANQITFAQLPFDHPLYIMFSSGTTGVPKCIVHSAGGTLLQHLKEHVLHGDLTRQDRLFYFTTCGWMMWNWLVSALAVGTTVALYDGSPFHPNANVLWDYAEDENITIFGTSAKYLSALEKAGGNPAKTHEIDNLKTVLSTGSPLLPESYDYVYRAIKADIRLSSISGGTDIISCFALGNPVLPVYRGELQSRGLGMAVAIYNDDGRPVCQEKGELVCTKPFPSMPIGFWNDDDGSKYRAAYFERFDNTWCHGDYAELTEHDGVVIYGRSDTVLNPGGVRIGTAEIYRQVETCPEVMESMAVGQDWEGDVRVVLFVRMQPKQTLSPELIDRLKARIREGASPRHVPAKIIEVTDIPRTVSGKIVELAVRNVIHGLPVKNKDALANPEALKLFENLPALQS
ncbi:acetoacetate--CoA ligase [Chitinivorax sp. B]|uniref:acetoacetate--CoA ligase n=1 Tax=Chitinivorax sp. B TaxID=2502235 RepID=UPI0010F80C86|nr:acetoacetate--CoA ligase [Chitinivorax sp. B]